MVKNMKKLIYIELEETYPQIAYKYIMETLEKHLKRVNKDLFQISEGLFLKFDNKTLLIFEGDEKEAV